ncbi:recombinase family protein [Brevibacterium sp. RIT 803]|uniref:recombinase family protein n=1 Tax=Brevibacterium sp. RIT 803 TaxID=2810210 RepID=UPI00194E854F|nr:recombinase family protein [Brevibacterium sp. RIT 803]MBM6589860.1 recombinase family protein [Brevibacterium sp. RIT 803]
MSGKIVAYVRVSSADQNEARQLEALESAGGYDKLFIEKISAKDRHRPQLTAMREFVREGDTVRVKSIDRLARSTRDLLDIVQEFSDNDVSVEFLDTPDMNIGSAQGKFMLTVMGAFAELERVTINERQREGIALAKAEGRFGKPRKLDAMQITDVIERRHNGEKVADLAADLGVSRQTIYTALKS